MSNYLHNLLTTHRSVIPNYETRNGDHFNRLILFAKKFLLPFVFMQQIPSISGTPVALTLCAARIIGIVDSHLAIQWVSGLTF